jgi:hypothetical protein
MPITKRGIDLHASPPPAPLPQLDASISPKVLDMIRMLIRHQQALASPHVKTVVIQIHEGGQASIKATFDLHA